MAAENGGPLPESGSLWLQDEAARDHLVEQYHALHSFAVFHPESGAICRAID